MTNPYYEGVLQLRNPTDEVIEYIHYRVTHDKKGKITQEKKVKGGTDFYFDSQHYLQALGKKLNKKFAGEFKVSPTLKTVSKVTSKRVYRVTVLFKVYPFQPGDIIHSKEGDLHLLSFKKKFMVKNLKTGRKQWMSVEELKKA